MTEEEVKTILLSLVRPSNPNDNIPSDIKGWRYPSENTDVLLPVGENDEQYQQPVCSWTGVTCDPIDGSVIGLNLGNGFYTTTLLGMTDDGVGEDRDPRALLQRGHLMILNKTRYPESNLTVKSRRMSSASMNPSFPSSLGQLRSLRFINLSSNRLQGKVPKEVLQLPNLEIFDISSNDLEGNFPHFESDVLRVLDISKNRFQGPLDDRLFGHPDIGPHTAHYVKSLVKFDISHNGFNGTIPLDGTSGYYDAITKRDESLQNLKYLDLGNNLCE